MESTGKLLESAVYLMEINIANAVVRSYLSPELINNLFLRRRSDQSDDTPMATNRQTAVRSGPRPHCWPGGMLPSLTATGALEEGRKALTASQFSDVTASFSTI